MSWQFNTLFESDRHAVVCMESQVGPVYEIVDKSAFKEVLLHGASARLFEAQRERWEENVPCEDEVTAVLDSFLELGCYPLVVH
jgi:hypothetical protein